MISNTLEQPQAAASCHAYCLEPEDLPLSERLTRALPMPAIATGGLPTVAVPVAVAITIVSRCMVVSISPKPEHAMADGRDMSLLLGDNCR